MSTSAAERSTQLREEGNVLYKAGELTERYIHLHILDVILIMYHQQLSKNIKKLRSSHLTMRPHLATYLPGTTRLGNTHNVGLAYESFRERGVAIWSTFSWSLEKKQVSAWMSRSFVGTIIEKDWLISTWERPGSDFIFSWKGKL
jgi:hypothetical protein